MQPNSETKSTSSHPRCGCGPSRALHIPNSNFSCQSSQNCTISDWCLLRLRDRQNGTEKITLTWNLRPQLSDVVLASRFIGLSVIQIPHKTEPLNPAQIDAQQIIWTPKYINPHNNLFRYKYYDDEMVLFTQTASGAFTSPKVCSRTCSHRIAISEYFWSDP